MATLPPNTGGKINQSMPPVKTSLQQIKQAQTRPTTGGK
jgi:hypothetical protein